MSLAWPSNEGAVLLWSELLLAWVVCEYLILGNEPIIAESGKAPNQHLLKETNHLFVLRALLLIVAILAICRWFGWRNAVLLILLPATAFALPLLRVVFAARSLLFAAELELGANVLVVLSTALLIGNPDPAPLRGLLVLPVDGSRLALALFTAAILVLLSTAGTHVVRGLLAKVGTLPTTTPQPNTSVSPAQIDIKEYNRGRLIGVIERLIMTALVAVSAYSALMFLMGAKGLIRSKEFEDHTFAEYFLIGTLASAAFAILFGLVLQALARSLW